MSQFTSRFIEHALYILLFPGDQMIVMAKYVAII